MTVRKTVGTVGTLAQEAVTTAVSLAKHPIGSTALAAGLVKGVAGAGIGLVRDTITGTSPTPDSETPRAEAPAETLAPEAEVTTPEPVHEPVERDLPGPDLAHFEPPRPEDLPEPIVIVADDAAYTNGESGEPFHNEPKASSRESEHGAGPLDTAEIDELNDELFPADEVEPRS